MQKIALPDIMREGARRYVWRRQANRKAMENTRCTWETREGGRSNPALHPRKADRSGPRGLSGLYGGGGEGERGWPSPLPLPCCCCCCPVSRRLQAPGPPSRRLQQAGTGSGLSSNARVALAGICDRGWGGGRGEALIQRGSPWLRRKGPPRRPPAREEVVEESENLVVLRNLANRRLSHYFQIPELLWGSPGLWAVALSGCFISHMPTQPCLQKWQASFSQQPCEEGEGGGAGPVGLPALPL